MVSVKIKIDFFQDFSELRQTIDDAFTKLEELEEEGRRSNLLDQIHCSPARFFLASFLCLSVLLIVCLNWRRSNLLELIHCSSARFNDGCDGDNYKIWSR